jgi:hypothetical protein
MKYYYMFSVWLSLWKQYWSQPFVAYLGPTHPYESGFDEWETQIAKKQRFGATIKIIVDA